jgi:hypothetical protein
MTAAQPLTTSLTQTQKRVGIHPWEYISKMQESNPNLRKKL